MLRYAITIFLSAFLLFQVQPIMGRYVLPWFGGSPAVWTACMLFFQLLLLGGYAYAHLISARLPRRMQALVHMLLLAVSIGFLPIGLAATSKPVDGQMATWQIIIALLFGVGAPYFLLSSTGPLLQRWFSIEFPDRSPYRLYALSNVGSLLALMSYPFLFEPVLTLNTQSLSWSWGYGAFQLGCAICAIAIMTRKPTLEEHTDDPAPSNPDDATAPKATDWVKWTLLAALGSVMLLATTNQMCQDVAVIPFLWVLPLAIYLLTFIVCFERDAWYVPGWYSIALIVAVALVAWGLDKGVRASLGIQVTVFSVGLFVCCMVCHGQMARSRPAAKYLTGFYLCLAAGGALGGALVAVAAPVIFRGYWEFPLGVMATCAVGIFAAIGDKSWWLFRARPTLAVALPAAGLGTLITFIAVGMFMRPPGGGRDRGQTLESSRNFYGVLRVLTVGEGVNEHYELEHGRITHGDQYHDKTKKKWPTTYYGHVSGVGITLKLKHDDGPVGLRVGVVGLGTGTIAAHGEKGDTIRFYEINEDVVRLAESYFSYLKDTAAKTEVIVGDARVMMEHEIARGHHQDFDVLVVDAFSGDAIPIHLLTRECARTYLAHLKQDGVLAFHTSNRFIELAAVVRGIAEQFDMKSVVIESADDTDRHIDQAQWILVTKSDRFMDQVEEYVKDVKKPIDKEIPMRAYWKYDESESILWTDDFSSVWSLLN